MKSRVALSHQYVSDFGKKKQEYYPG